MAAVGNKLWYVDSPQTRVPTTHCEYLKGLKPIQIVERVGLTMAQTSSCAGLGAMIGLTAPAPGGAAVGALIGGGFGMLLASGLFAQRDRNTVQDMVNRLPGLGMEGLNNIVMQAGLKTDDICPITDSVPLQPARIHGERQVYEFASLREHILIDRERLVKNEQGDWVKNTDGNARSPISRLPCRLEDIERADDAEARIGKLCDRVLHTPNQVAQLTPEQRDGLAMIRMQHSKASYARYQEEKRRLDLMERLGKISPSTHLEELLRINKLLDPALGNEGSPFEYERVPRDMRPSFAAGPANFEEERKD